MSKFMVTGGSGFIGSALVRGLLSRGADRVAVIDNLLTGKEENLTEIRGAVDFHKVDIRDYDGVLGAMQGVECVFHEAAIPSVPRSIHEPVPSHEVNIDGTFNVLRAAREAGVRRVIYAASSSAYGDTEVLPKVESMQPSPKSPYAAQKLMGEYYLSCWHGCFGMETVALRYFNVFGPRQDPQSQYAAAVPIFIDRAVKNQPITIYGDGEQTRDFIYVKDIVAANVFFATQSKATGVFNVAYGKKITIKELAQKICALTGSQSEIKHAPERAGDVKHSLAAIDKLRAAGFAPTSNFEDGLAATIRGFQGKPKN
jgi:UDP-glucose 4-epimerase